MEERRREDRREEREKTEKNSIERSFRGGEMRRSTLRIGDGNGRGDNEQSRGAEKRGGRRKTGEAMGKRMKAERKRNTTDQDRW